MNCKTFSREDRCTSRALPARLRAAARLAREARLIRVKKNLANAQRRQKGGAVPGRARLTRARRPFASKGQPHER